jgi:hypothetical protein
MTMSHERVVDRNSPFAAAVFDCGTHSQVKPLLEAALDVIHRGKAIPCGFVNARSQEQTEFDPKVI